MESQNIIVLSFEMSTAKHIDTSAVVDKYVSKPILGSDGAAAWLQFRTASTSHSHSHSNNSTNNQSKGTSPLAPLSLSDRKAGFVSWQAEREHEIRARHDPSRSEENVLGYGYTNFRHKEDKNHAPLTKKRKHAVLNRIRPEDVPYFISATVGTEHKFDYVFDTRSTYGTGYYWDGTDSQKKIQLQAIGKGQVTDVFDDYLTTNYPKSIEISKIALSLDAENNACKKMKRKREDNMKSTSETKSIDVDDTYNPRAQIAALHYRQHQHKHLQLGQLQMLDPRPQSSVSLNSNSCPLPVNWETALDPQQMKYYYYNIKTHEVTWEFPQVLQCEVDPIESGTTDSVTKEISTFSPCILDNSDVDNKWHQTTDFTTGQEYYYHAVTGETRWECPLSHKTSLLPPSDTMR
jgi:hypothetical protein